VFGPADPGVSFGRIETSQGPDFAGLLRTTFGADQAATVEGFRAGRGLPNTAPRVGPLVITELMYAPPAAAGAGANAVDPDRVEFVELFQAGDRPVDLFDSGDPDRVWRLAGAVEFAFPAGLTLLPGAYAVVVPFDPIGDRTEREAFRSRYNVDQTVRLLGPWLGRLADGGDVLRLERPLPGAADPDGGPYVAVEAVRYTPRTPWPTIALGTGMSAQRLRPLDYGNEPGNWHAGWPTPGRPNPTDRADLDGDGLPDDWELEQGLNPGVATGDDGPDGDPDGDGLINRIELALGTSARTAGFLITAIRVASDGVRIGFNAVPGRAYVVESRDALDGGAWQWVANILPPATPQIVQVRTALPPAVTARYYRVRKL
jgi:hypothetical protein